MAAKSLYVHIPFCRKICSYCDFCKILYREQFSLPYLKELEKEIVQKADHPFETIYVGGGTPTCLKEEELEELLSFLSPLLEEGGEFTIEANPDSLSISKLKLLKKAGVNRLSIGLESSDEALLKTMGRTHTFSDVENAVKLAKSVGFTNISIDMIYALPNEDMQQLERDIESMLSLDVPHLSAYSLTVSEGTIFHNKGIKEAEDEIQAKMYEAILGKFQEAGYERYEVSNFAKPSFKSRHNLTYWHDEEYVACGLGASGYENSIRYRNTKNLSKYLKGEHLEEQEEVGEEDDLSYYFLCNLRLADGFSLEVFQSRFGFPFFDRYQSRFQKLKDDGLLFEEDGRVKPTDRGILLLDRILLCLFPD